MIKRPTGKILASLFAAILFALTGCAPMIAVPGPASMDAPMTVNAERAYVLGPGDTIKLTVYGEETLTGEYTLDQRSTVTIPLIGQVDAAGMTKQDLQSKIADLLVAGRYLQKPEVTVNMVTARPFFILGQVTNPGSYASQPGLNVLKAIALAGGYSPRAAHNMILIDRDTSRGHFHMNATEDTPVLPGDSITVRERIF